MSDLNSDRYGLAPVKSALTLGQLGAIDGITQRHIARMGDAVAVALIKVIDQSQLFEENTVRLALQLIKVAFGNPQLITEAADRKPSVTLLLLDSIAQKTAQISTRNEANYVRKFVLDRLGRCEPG